MNFGESNVVNEFDNPFGVSTISVSQGDANSPSRLLASSADLLRLRRLFYWRRTDLSGLVGGESLARGSVAGGQVDHAAGSSTGVSRLVQVWTVDVLPMDRCDRGGG